MQTSQSYRPPPLACNAGVHIFGPFDRFPLPGHRAAAEATYEAFVRMQAELGFERGVVTQPTHYGVDNACVLDALARAGGRLRGVVSLMPADLRPARIAELDRRGVRGVRIHWAPQFGPGIADLEAVAERLRGTEWHIEIGPPPIDLLVEQQARFERLGVPVIVGQMARPEIARGTGHPSFVRFAGMVRDGVLWTKLTLPYAPIEHPYEAARPFAEALVAAAPGRCVFATSWPHVSGLERGSRPDDRRLVDLFADWVSDEALRRKILVENPAAFYGFDR